MWTEYVNFNLTRVKSRSTLNNVDMYKQEKIQYLINNKFIYFHRIEVTEYISIFSLNKYKIHPILLLVIIILNIYKTW